MQYKRQISQTTTKIAQTKKTTHDMCNVAHKIHVNNFRASCSLPLLAISFLAILGCLLPLVSSTEPLKVIYAVNAGGDRHTDQNGIHYTGDTLNVGIASDYGKHLLMIGRVQEQDELLYRTERYHTTTFGYDFPADGDGNYALIMKFCEVYFDAPNRKVFDVLLNRRHTVVKQLDIYDRVGRGSAHDEIVYFKISNGRLFYETASGETETSDVRNGQLRLDFIKGALDNPKINAFALLKGDTSQLPRLHGTEASERRVETDEEDRSRPSEERIVRYNERQAAQRSVDEDVDEDDDYDFDEQSRQRQQQHNQQPQQQQQDPSMQGSKRVRSGPRQPNPYSMDDSSLLMPMFVALCAFIPLVFCLCRL